MATVGEISDKLGASPQTVRAWGKTFARYLSPTANPPTNQPRAYTVEDERILRVVARMRSDLATFEDIEAALKRGERDDPPEIDHQGEPDGGTGTGLTVQRMTALMGEQQGVIRTLTEERDHLRDELTTTREKHEAALQRAARAEGKLEAMESLHERQTVQSEPAAPQPPVEQRATVVPEEPKRKSWLDRLMGR